MNLLAAIRHKLAISTYPYRSTHRAYVKKFDGRELDPQWLLEQRQIGQETYVPTDIELRSFGSSLRVPFLSKTLASDRLGEWALDARTIDFFEDEIKIKRPRALLEFGAGISTICFCHFLKEIHAADAGVLLYSVEQNAWQVEQTKERIEKLGMSAHIKILLAPQKRQTVEGQTGEFYDIDTADFENFIQDAPIDMIVIDGPVGDSNVRYGALPLLRKYISGAAPFYLDDSFRSEELDVLLSWSKIDYIQSVHVKAIGKGIGCGMILGTAANAPLSQ